MIANGLAHRRFRSRSRCTAASSVASQARWYPPRPLIATIRPTSRSAAAAARAAPSSEVAPGASVGR